jgi:hypothetical protein
MYREKLEKILIRCNPEDGEAISDSLYASPAGIAERLIRIPIPESWLEGTAWKLLCFDYKKFGFTYKEGVINRSQVRMEFLHPAYDHLVIYMDYDFWKRTVFNWALLVPRYTEGDCKGKKSLYQVANLVRSEANFKRYKTKIDKKYKINHV